MPPVTDKLTAAVEAYLTHLRQIQTSGGATPELSFRTPLENLLDAVGGPLKPKVGCVGEMADQGAGHPDFGQRFWDSGSPWVSEQIKCKTGRRAPLLGEHTNEVLRETRRRRLAEPAYTCAPNAHAFKHPTQVRMDTLMANSLSQQVKSRPSMIDHTRW